MFDLQEKVKRQLEILGLCLAADAQLSTNIIDLTEYFHVEVPTIRRDMQDLRGMGIPLHSSGKKGLSIQGEIPEDLVTSILHHYGSILSFELSHDKATSMLVKAHGLKSLSFLVLLQFCIDRSKTVVIEYQKRAAEPASEREIEPFSIIQRENAWRLLAKDDGILKQFKIEKITSVKVGRLSFTKEAQSEETELFRHSWKAWMGKNQIPVKLLFSSEWADRLNPPNLMIDQKITTQPDGSLLVEMVVNGYSEIAAWIAGRGKGVVVLEPETLRERVISLAKDALSNYELL